MIDKDISILLLLFSINCILIKQHVYYDFLIKAVLILNSSQKSYNLNQEMMKNGGFDKLKAKIMSPNSKENKASRRF